MRGWRTSWLAQRRPEEIAALGPPSFPFGCGSLRRPVSQAACRLAKSAGGEDSRSFASMAASGKVQLTLVERQDLILGGGLSGMTAAYTLQRAGEDWWQLYERESRLGGLARSTAVEGDLFDYGPHILVTIAAEIEALVRELLGDNFHAQERRAFIYHHSCRRYTRFPFQAHLFGLPVAVGRDCLVGLVRAGQR